MSVIPENCTRLRLRSLEPGDRFCYPSGARQELNTFHVDEEITTTQATTRWRAYQFFNEISRSSAVREVSRLFKISFLGDGAWSVYIDVLSGQAYLSERDYQLGQPHSTMIIPNEIFLMPPLPPIEKGIPF